MKRADLLLPAVNGRHPIEEAMNTDNFALLETISRDVSIVRGPLRQLHVATPLSVTQSDTKRKKILISALPGTSSVGCSAALKLLKLRL